jgi:hypothetical protein
VRPTALESDFYGGAGRVNLEGGGAEMRMGRYLHMGGASLYVTGTNTLHVPVVAEFQGGTIWFTDHNSTLSVAGGGELYTQNTGYRFEVFIDAMGVVTPSRLTVAGHWHLVADNRLTVRTTKVGGAPNPTANLEIATAGTRTGTFAAFRSFGALGQAYEWSDFEWFQENRLRLIPS